MMASKYLTLGGAKTLVEAEDFIIEKGVPVSPDAILAQVVINLSGAQGGDARLIKRACADYQREADRRGLEGLKVLRAALEDE